MQLDFRYGAEIVPLRHSVICDDVAIATARVEAQMGRSLMEMRSLAAEFPDAIKRMKACLRATGRVATDEQVVWAWSEYSESVCASWLLLPESDDDLVVLLLRHWPACELHATGCIATLTAGDFGGSPQLSLPEEVIRKMGWTCGDEVELQRQGDSLVVRGH
ncbi:AbrB/MazE/SpoVT family DNA-binding domain-containing protein [Paraburkholderia caffeinilytica]|nr:AbrB/MazE/SpoVT family DNA-binding domain-containing protein [Paraburkholderia caffeinilytica]